MRHITGLQKRGRLCDAYRLDDKTIYATLESKPPADLNIAWRLTLAVCKSEAGSNTT